MAKKRAALTIVVALIIVAAAGVTFVLLRGKEKSSKPVRIGLIAPLTGDAELLGDSIKKGVEMSLNESGLSNVELIIEDTSCLPENVTPAVNRLIESHGVIAIVGEACSGATLAAAPIAEHNEVVLISPASTNPDISRAGQYVFRTVPSDTFQSFCAAKDLKARGFSKVAVLFGNEPYGIGYAGPLIQALNTSEYGAAIEAVGLPFDRGTTDFSKYLDEIERFEADAVFIISNSESSLADAVIQIKSRLPEISVSSAELLSEQDLIDQIGAPADGARSITFSGGTDDFVRRYRAMYGEDPSVFAAQAYDAFDVLAIAIARGADSGELVRHELLNLDFDGASGHIRFDSKGDVGGDCFISEIVDGKVLTPKPF